MNIKYVHMNVHSMYNYFFAKVANRNINVNLIVFSNRNLCMLHALIMNIIVIVICLK